MLMRTFCEAVLQSDRFRIKILNLFAILANGAIRLEFSHTVDIQNGHAPPLVEVAISMSYAGLSIAVRLIVR